MTSRRTAGGVAALAALVLLCGCVQPGTKAGVGGVPITLRLATVEQRSNTPYVPELEAFVDAVERDSHGSIQVEVEWMQQGSVADAETRVARSVRAGEVDLAVIPARSFSELGVNRLNALQTPFIIDSAELASAVAESEIGEAMLDDLADDDFVGLALAYESLRHPLGYELPLLEARDYAGIGIRTPESAVARKLFEQLDARPAVSRDYHEDGVGRPLAGAESAFAWWAAIPAGSVMTANVTFYPKLNAFVAAPALWDRLDREQRGIVLAAAREAAHEASADVGDEIEAAGRFCLAGNRVAFAESEAVGALIDEVAPVRAWLEQDPIVAADIRDIEELKASIEPGIFELPWPCRPRTGDWAPWPDGD